MLEPWKDDGWMGKEGGTAGSKINAGGQKVTDTKAASLSRLTQPSRHVHSRFGSLTTYSATLRVYV